MRSASSAESLECVARSRHPSLVTCPGEAKASGAGADYVARRERRPRPIPAVVPTALSSLDVCPICRRELALRDNSWEALHLSLSSGRTTRDQRAVPRASGESVRSAAGAARQRGYLLLEIAIALVIVGLLAGSLLSHLPQQLEQVRREVTQQRLQQVRTALLGYLLRHQRLPCPSANGHSPDRCSGAALSGYVPAQTLGLAGAVDQQGQLLDAWHRPIHYQVSGADSAVSGRLAQPDFLVSGELRRVGMQYLRPDLEVCSVPAQSLCPRYALRASEVPFMVWSNGRFLAESIAEKANRDGDRLFNNVGYSGSINSGEQRFDDVMLWVSSSELIMHLVDAGVLP